MSKILPKTENSEAKQKPLPTTNPDVLGGFMFVPQLGRRVENRSPMARRSIRAHVMHNFLDQQQSSANQGHKRAPTKPLDMTSDSGPSVGGGKKLKFRLRSTGLEQTLPSRPRRKGVRDVVRQNPGQSTISTTSIAETQALWDSTMEYRSQPFIDGQSERGPAFYLVDPSPFINPLNNTSKDLASWSSSPLFERDHQVGDMHPWHPLQRSPAVEMQVNEEEDVRKWPWDPDYLSTAPLQSVSSTSVTDPFNVLPFRLNPTEEILLDRFQHYTERAWCPINAQGSWFEFALRDELLFHATIYHWSLKYNDRQNNFLTRNPVFVEQKLAAIRLINQRLADPVTAASDETLAAVSAIVHGEVGFGTKDEAVKHIHGLYALIEMRGGIERLDGVFGGLLVGFIGWIDLAFSELVGNNVRFVKLGLQSGVYEDHGPCFRSDLSVLGVDQPRIWREPFEGELVVLFHRIRQLCDVVERRPFLVLDQAERRFRSDSLQEIERRLRVLASSSAETQQSDPKHTVWRACAAAGLIYVHHVLRELPLRYRNFDTLCLELQDILRQTEIGSPMGEKWAFAPPLLVWALTVGEVISLGRGEHGYFVERLVAACREYGVLTWTQYRELLAGFLWVGSVDDTRYGRVWEQIQPLI